MACALDRPSTDPPRRTGGAPLILKLHDAGGYLTQVRRLSTGRLLLLKSLRVILPTSFPVNSFLLLTALALAGFLSGWRGKGSLAGSGNFCGAKG